MPLPPYGRQFVDVIPSSGIRVWIGPSAWDRAKRCGYPAMVLPDETDPAEYRWPVESEGVLVFEHGVYDTDRLERVAQVLLENGAQMVYPIRTGHFGEGVVYRGQT